MESEKGIIVCDDPGLCAKLCEQLAFVPVLPLTEYSPNGTPAVIVTAPHNLSAAGHALAQISETARAQSVITGRTLPEEHVPIRQPLGMVLLPWCNDEAFAQWVSILSSLRTQPVFPEWFFLHSSPPNKNLPVLEQLETVVAGLPYWSSHQLLVANVAEKSGLSSRYLQKFLPKSFGVKPGQLLRALEVFASTAKLMQQEAKLSLVSRRGNSPLHAEENQYRRRLRRLLGITYTELLQASKTEHWAAAWMRRWRESILLKLDEVH